MTESEPLRSPYKLGDQTTRGRLQAEIPLSDYVYLRSIFPGHGQIQLIFQNLIHGLITDLRASGITRTSRCAASCGVKRAVAR